MVTVEAFPDKFQADFVVGVEQVFVDCGDDAAVGPDTVSDPTAIQWTPRRPRWVTDDDRVVFQLSRQGIRVEAPFLIA